MEFATIGGALSSRRKALNIDQARAAAIIGMSRTTFSSYERDLQRPSAEVLPSLAHFLDISVEDILTLYGGTCIAALRPALEQILAAQDSKDGNLSKVVVSVESGDAVVGPGSENLSRELDDSDAPTPAIPDLVSSAVPWTAADSDSPRDFPLGLETSQERVAPLVGAKESVSIFANELSDDLDSPEVSPSITSDSDRSDPKVSKGKGGKKKKGKKGKREKS